MFLPGWFDHINSLNQYQKVLRPQFPHLFGSYLNPSSSKPQIWVLRTAGGMIPYPQLLQKLLFLQGGKFQVVCCRVRDPSKPQPAIRLRGVSCSIWTPTVPLTPPAKASPCPGKSCLLKGAPAEVVPGPTRHSPVLRCILLLR